jgi:hypothetical protein
MKPFDLEAAKRGDPLVTRDGRKAQFIAHAPKAASMYRVVALIEAEEMPYLFGENGHFREGSIVHDLFMAPKKRTVFVQVFDKETEHSPTKSGEPSLHAVAFDSESDARDNERRTMWGVLVAALPVEIEE